MKIVIAPDSFKDSLDAAGVARAIAAGLSEAWPEAELVECPMADGGEGTMEVILAASRGELRRQTVRGPLGQYVEAGWGWLPQSRTAIIEMAQASGLQQVPTGQRDACRSSTWGTGELIAAALDSRRPACGAGHRRQRHQRCRQWHVASTWPAPAGC